MKNIISAKQITYRLFYILLLSGLSTFLCSQQFPYQLQNDMQQKVTFSKNIDFRDAIEILGKMAIQFESRTIIDQTKQAGPIGIDIPTTHWKNALAQILSQRGLKYEQLPNYYQIIGSMDNKPQNQTKSNMPSGEFNSETREVKINAIFFQADRIKLKNAGIDWNIVQNSSGLTLKTLTLGANFGVQTQATEGQLSGKTITHQTTNNDGSVDINALLSFFESNDLGKVLAKPSIHVVDGIEGQIHVGTKFSINQRDFSGNTITQFQDAGTILKVTPEIIEDSSLIFIHLKIEAEKSSAKQGLGDKPEISTQKAITDVLLLDGEQTMIGGLFIQEEQVIRSGIPFLKDLPWWFLGIRYLTGYNSTTVKNNELVIFIQVELMEKLEDRIAKKKQNVLANSLRDNTLQTRKNYLELKKASDDAAKIKDKELQLSEKKKTIYPTIKKLDSQKKHTEQTKKIEKIKKQNLDTKTISEEKKISEPKQKLQKPLNDDTKLIIKKLTKETDSNLKPTPKIIPQNIQTSETKKTVSTTKIEQEKTNEIKVITSDPVVVTESNPIQKILDKKVEEDQAEKFEKVVSAKKIKKENLKPRYTIQIFSSDNYQNTLDEIEQFKEQNIEVYIIKQQVKGKLIYRVRSGRYVYFSEAKKELQKIHNTFPGRKDMWIDNL